MGLKTKISKLTKKELVDLLTAVAETDENIEAMLEYKLSGGEDEIKESKKLIRTYINRYKWKGFISLRYVPSSLQGAEMVLDKGRDKLAAGESEMAAKLAIAVLSIVVDMMQYADDSNGAIGGAIEESISLIGEAASYSVISDDKNTQKKVFQLIMKEANHTRYDGWSNWQFDLLKICTLFSIEPTMRQKLEKKLNQLLEKLSGESSSWSKEFDTIEIMLLQLEILELNQEWERAGEFIYEHIQYSDFREKAIRYELENENTGSALKLSREGQIQDKELPGLVTKWKEYELKIYEVLEDIENQRKILLELVFNNSFEAYKKLKKLYNEEEWKTVAEKIFDGFEETGNNATYIEIAKEENRQDKLYRICIEDNFYIQELYPYLMDEYHVEAEMIFKNFIHDQAEPAGSRKHYRGVCKLIGEYKKAFGKTSFIQLKEELQEKYKRRPTFLDELEKV
jgi:hypothetical protein